MTLLTHIIENDPKALKKHLSHLLECWSYNILNNTQEFNNSEELFQFFLLDIISTFYYSLKKDKQLSDRTLAYMKKIILDIESHN